MLVSVNNLKGFRSPDILAVHYYFELCFNHAPEYLTKIQTVFAHFLNDFDEGFEKLDFFS